MTKKNFVILSLSILLLSVAPGLRAADQTLWEIGKFDQSSFEFNSNLNEMAAKYMTDPHYSPVFVVGKSDPSKDWPAMQPGSQNRDAGAKPYPYTIVFTLDQRPRGTYRLTVSVLLTHSRVPNLGVEINGHRGEFFFDRKMSYYPGDGGVDSPVYGGDRIEISLPASFLRAGENKLLVTALDDPKDGPGDSWLNYDALRLTHDDAEHAARVQVKAEPTDFYVPGAGGLSELTSVTVTANEPLRDGRVTAKIGDRTADQAIEAGGRDFGEWREDIALPEFKPGTAAELMVRVNGRTQRSHVVLQPKRKWTLYVAPHAHLDIGFTDYAAKVAEIHSRNVDKLLDEIDAHPDMRFSLDGSWIVRQFLATRSPEAHQRLFKLIREGKIAVPAQFASLMTGYPTLEELIRSTDNSRRLHREDGLPFDYANITDVPSYTWSYPSVLNALGIKYFSAAANSDRAPILLYGRWNEKSPFWWQGPDGGKVLMSYARQYFQFSFVCGLPEQKADCRQSLPTFLQQYESPGYKPDSVLMYGSQIENTDLTPGEPEFVKKWNEQYAYPKIVFATFPDYMRYIDENFGSQLATVTGDGGPYWEDGYATDVHYLAIDRATQQRAPAAEELSTIGTYLQKNVSGPAAQIERMWDDLVLYAEHTFTSWGGHSRPESEETVRQFAAKDQLALDGHQQAEAIVEQSLSQLADAIHLQATARVVFNSLSWTRSGLVEMDLDGHNAILELPARTPVPVEVLAHHEGYDHVRFLARDVPSFGYKCYQVVDEHEHAAAPAGETPLATSNILENTYYRVEVEPAAGAIKSIYDKNLGRELVDSSSPYRFNQYLYVAGGEDHTQIVHLRKALPLANLMVEGANGGKVMSLRKTSYGAILTYETSGPHAPALETEVRLFDDEKKIEIENQLRKEPVSNKEAVYFAFPVSSGSKPEFAYEIQNGWVDPARDLLKGAGVEWFTVQHWVKVSSPDLSVAVVPVDAPLVTLGDVNRGTWPDKFEPKSGTIFSYAMNNYWHTNFRRVQSGDFVFRYVIASGHDLPPAELARLGRAAMTPLEIGELTHNDKFGDPERPLSPAPTSFLKLDTPDVVVENWKRADDGRGTVVRLLETGGATFTARLEFPLFTLDHAWRTSAAENDQQALTIDGRSVDVSLKPHEIVSVRITGPKVAQ